MSSMSLKYYITARLDNMLQFVRCHLKRLILFAVALIFGLVMGILSSLKPIDPLEALDSANGGIYGLIVRASFAGYIFPLLLFTIAVFCAFCFIGRSAYSFLLTAAFTVLMGFFQGAVIVLVLRSFGLLALPFVIFYIIFSLLRDLLLISFFCILAQIAAEKRKYGCTEPFVKLLLRVLPIAIVSLILCLFQSVFLILFSFFL